MVCHTALILKTKALTTDFFCLHEKEIKVNLLHTTTHNLVQQQELAWLRLWSINTYVLVIQCATEIRYRYREPKPGLNFGIGIGAETFSAETQIESYCIFCCFLTIAKLSVVKNLLKFGQI